LGWEIPFQISAKPTPPASSRAPGTVAALIVLVGLGIGAMRLTADDADAHYKLGEVLANNKDWDGAIGEYREAIRLKPDYPEAHVGLGWALDSKKDSDGAIGEFREAIRLNPNYAQAHVGLGWELESKTNWDGAIAEYREAIRLNPDYFPGHAHLEWALENKKDWDGAIRELREVIRLEPDRADAHSNLGWALANKNDADGAIREFREAIRLDPDYAQAHVNLEWALERKKDWDGAIRELHEVIRLEPDRADAHSSLGEALENKGDLMGAFMEYRAAHSLDPKEVPSPVARFWRLAPLYVRLLIILLLIASAFAFAKMLDLGAKALAKRRARDRTEAASRLTFRPATTANADIGQLWSPPQELTLPTPRPVRRVKRGRGARFFGYGPHFVAGPIIFGSIPALFVLGWSDEYRSTLWTPLDLYALSVAGVEGMVFLLFWWLYHSTYRKREQLLMWGRPARAVVTHVVFEQGRNYRRWVSTLEYQDDAGKLVKTKLSSRSSVFSTNQVLTVLYDPDKPRRYMIYPVVGFEIAEPKGSLAGFPAADTGRKNLNWFAGILLLGGLAYLALAWYRGGVKYAMLKSWPTVDAQVTKSRITEEQPSGGVDYYSAEVEIRYQVNGKEYVTPSSLGYSTSHYMETFDMRDRYAPGTHHPIRYNPSNPSDVWFPAGYESGILILTGVVGFLGVLFCAFGAGSLLASRSRDGPGPS